MHTECQDFALADCKENATYLPGKDLAQVKHTHHWREGNLPSSSKCAVCKKNCFSAEYLSGFRCEWCGMTVMLLFCKLQFFIPYVYSIDRKAKISKQFYSFGILILYLIKVSNFFFEKQLKLNHMLYRRRSMSYTSISFNSLYALIFLEAQVDYSKIIFNVSLHYYLFAVALILSQKYPARMYLWELGTNLLTTACSQHSTYRGSHGGHNRCTSTSKRSPGA